MGFLSKDLIIKAYESLSNLTTDHKQGQTQIVSLLRYVCALDRFCVSNDTDKCDLSDVDYRDEYTNNVVSIVNVEGLWYTTNFYDGLKQLEDAGVGSNFYSAGVVSKSKENTSTMYDYPTRGSNPVFQVKNNTLYRDKGLYSNVSHFLSNDDLKCGFIIWLSRNNEIDELTLDGLCQSLLDDYSDDLIKELSPNVDYFNQYIGGFSLEDNLSNLKCGDIPFMKISNNNNNFSVTRRNVSMENLSDNQSKILLALRTKPFVLLAGISGTGKSRIVRELAFASCPERLQDEDGTTPGNYCMVEVKPNWHDSTELLGYYSSVSKKYYLTKFIHFLYKASLDENKNIPFFVCLDEMNLAPVEQYFAEFLSVLETRKFANNHIVTEQLIKKEEFEKCELPEEDDTVGNTRVQLLSDIKYSSKELEIIKHLKENGLVLPENLFVIGTVNMDDTTHQFSRKVIDRAMTIEMNGGKLMDMFGGSKKLAYVPDPLPLGAFLSKYVTADEVIEAHGNCEVQIKNITVELLGALNNTLKNTPFQISYRVLNELVIYLGNVLDDKGYDGDGMDETFTDYVSESFANIVMMKVLPRIEGDQELLDGKLEGIQAMTRNEKLNAKLQEMIDRLEDQSFTRFWA